MSPIGRPSVLDVMDVTDVSADDQELSLYGPESVKNQPRMSTHKLPHLIKREGSEDCSKFDTKVCVCTSQGSFSIYRDKRGNLPTHRPPSPPTPLWLSSPSPFKLCMLHMHACTQSSSPPPLQCLLTTCVFYSTPATLKSMPTASYMHTFVRSRAYPLIESPHPPQETFRKVLASA